MLHKIRVEPLDDEVYEVTVSDATGRSAHRVRVTEADRSSYGGGADVAILLEESFRFLLEREPKEAILARFDLGLIAHYFPEYPHEIRERLD